MRRSACLLLLFTSGCSFVHLKREVQRINKTAYVLGSLTGELDASAPIYLVHLVGTKKRSVQRLTPQFPEFDLLVRLGEVNDVEVFQDLDGDLIYDVGEPCGYQRKLDNLESLGKAAVELPPLRLDPETTLPVPLALDTARTTNGGTFGEVVPLTDARYSDERISEGVWTPLRATRRGGWGIHFLEPHRAGRLPVLFVHGIHGSPRNFEQLIARLDRTKYEPWVAYYPSGIRLPVLSQILAGLLSRAKDSVGVDRLFIVAHSMGGLVARGALLLLAEKSEPSPVAALVTLGTPWGGHPGAAFAVENAPEAVPSWIDMAPKSKFLHTLEQPLTVPQYLFFGIGGRSSKYDDNNDGVVTVASQLPRWAQDQSRAVIGFNENHMGILNSAEVEAKLWPLLK